MFILIQGQMDRRSGDTLVVDSVAGHLRTFEALTAFLAAPDKSIEISASGPCHMCPDSPTLRAFRMVKSDGQLMTQELPEGVLQVSGRRDLLARFADHFRFDPGNDGEHRHPENAFGTDLASGTFSIIIEVDEYSDDPERWAADNRDGSA